MIERIKAAKSIERLNFLAWVIKEDCRDDIFWTRDKNHIKELREIWKKKQNELTRQKLTPSIT